MPQRNIERWFDRDLSELIQRACRAGLTSTQVSRLLARGGRQMARVAIGERLPVVPPMHGNPWRPIRHEEDPAELVALFLRSRAEKLP